jgi:hypothetical protein
MFASLNLHKPHKSEEEISGLSGMTNLAQLGFLNCQILYHSDMNGEL